MPEAYFRALPGSTGDFEKAVDRWFKVRSTELKAVVAGFNRYLKTPGAAGLVELVAILQDWRKKQPAEFMDRAVPFWKDLWMQLLAEIERYPENHFPGISEIPVPMGTDQVLNWVNERLAGSDGLAQFSEYACLDATTFSQCINGAKKADVLKREADWKKGQFPAFGTNAAMALPGPNKDFDFGSLRVNYTRIKTQGGRGAVCTTFAFLGAHVLLSDRPTGPRVEVVSFPNGTASHVYVLVGRRGWPSDHIPDDWKAVIVDPWAAALGHPCVYRTRNEFIFPGMTQGLQLIKQRLAPW